MHNKKLTKGYISYFIEMDEQGEIQITTDTEEYNLSDEIVKSFYAERPIYDLINGINFLDDVRSGNFINYDGSISEIYIDDYRTNLGLIEEGIVEGDFMVNGNFFEELCKNHKVEVNWANK